MQGNTILWSTSLVSSSFPFGWCLSVTSYPSLPTKVCFQVHPVPVEPLVIANDNAAPSWACSTLRRRNARKSYPRFPCWATWALPHRITSSSCNGSRSRSILSDPWYTIRPCSWIYSSNDRLVWTGQNHPLHKRSIRFSIDS